ncbi:MAG: outer membrane beta-barrel protein [Prolixibacteraceae bacterium]|nr:outer membrane beta-barrel protein [Prolixibacteraceae bacterium]
MKIKIAILSISMLVFSVNVFAQKGNRFNVSFFTKGNYHAFSTHYYKLDDYYDYNENTEVVGVALNASLGLAANVPLNKSFAFYPRLGYTKIRGLVEDAYSFYPDVPDTIRKLGNIAETRFYFITTDFLLKYYLPLGKTKKYYLYGGLRTDFLLWDDEVLYNNESIFEGMNDFNLSYVGGLGFDFWKGFYFNLEYSNNITNFIKNDRYLIRYFSVSASLGIYVF